ncbi:DUF3800 domain-containing protein [Hyphomicrobium sp.]|uniref:DUF3800 domain-containing protein n=1 Tax=Hyphomicrobium sp. TaxID=82 RepID=UPI001DB1032A|nr:DUF3800 domain-containing protein [Hyphomicrobium sp.]MBY0560263.1 DUF3800 domain-containing protein [Hyphomicrobium sp.]
MLESAKVSRDINPGIDKDEQLARFIFPLIFQFAANFGMTSVFHVFIDSPDGREGPDPALRSMLNNKSYSHFKQRSDPFHTVKYVRSENSRLIQAVDLLSGAVAYESNSLHLANKTSAHNRGAADLDQNP